MESTSTLARVKGTLRSIGSYFNLRADLLPQQDAETEIRSAVSFKGSQLLILIFAIFVASLGLNTNSVPVIIGAMIISPLMGPIMGIGLGIGVQDFGLVKRSTRNICMAVLGSVLASAVYFLISPQYEGSSELLARTSPSIYDVFIALFGGAAGIVSVTCRNKASVMAGVAIATSLMPPLCTAGYGLATMKMQFLLGALYLFFTNAVFILFATWIGVKVFGYKKVAITDEKKAHTVRFILYTLVTLTIGVSVFLTVIMIRTNIFTMQAAEFVDKEFVFPNTQVLSHKEYVDRGKRYIDVNLIGATLPMDSILNIKQGFGINSEQTSSVTDDDSFMRVMEQELTQRQMTIDSLRSEIAMRHSLPAQSRIVAPEVKVLFPSIHSIALSELIAASTSSQATDTATMAFVNAPAGLSAAQISKLAEYLQVRLKRDNVHIALNPASVPWPK